MIQPQQKATEIMNAELQRLVEARDPQPQPSYGNSPPGSSQASFQHRSVKPFPSIRRRRFIGKYTNRN